MKRLWLAAAVVWCGVAVLALRGADGGNWSRKEQSPVASLPFGVEISQPVTPSSEPRRVATIILAGDVMPGRIINIKARERGEFDFLFANGLLVQADAAWINLESPITSDCPNRREGFRFCADWRVAGALARAGVKVANLANNHIGNEGQKGIEETKRFLREAGIKFTGAGEEVIEEINGIRVGMVGFNDVGPCPAGIECASEEAVRRQVAEVAKRADVALAQFHWGSEYTSRQSQRQERLARTAVEAGAEVVFGAHPHWTQGVEEYMGKMIFYSLGNFLFDQQWSRETQQGAMVKLELDKKGLRGYEIIPVVVDKTFVTRLADEAERREVWARMGLREGQERRVFR